MERPEIFWSDVILLKSNKRKIEISFFKKKSFKGTAPDAKNV